MCENLLVESCCYIAGRKGLSILVDEDCPEEVLEDKSLVGLNSDELKNALKKPFVTTKELNIAIKYNSKDYDFIIPKGYDWNGANIPSFAWVLIGQPKDPRFKFASCVHDYLCENKNVIDYNRYLSTLIFDALCCYFARLNSVKRWAVFHSVDNFQKLQRWRA